MSREQKIIVALVGALFLACNVITCLSGSIVGGVWTAAIGRTNRWSIQPTKRDFTHYPPTPSQPPKRPKRMLLAALVIEVIKDSPAAQAGLQSGDLILSIDGKGIEPGDDLKVMLSAYQPGDRIALAVRRDDREKEIKVKLGQHPQNRRQPYLGLTYRLVPAGP